MLWAALSDCPQIQQIELCELCCENDDDEEEKNKLD